MAHFIKFTFLLFQVFLVQALNFFRLVLMDIWLFADPSLQIFLKLFCAIKLTEKSLLSNLKKIHYI